MKGVLKKISGRFRGRKSSDGFLKSVLTLMTGTVVAQAIPIAVTPILTRLYSPSDFGLFAIYVSLVMVIGSIASGRYELAVMLPEEDNDALNVAALGLVVAAVVSVLLLLAVLVWGAEFSRLLGNSEIRVWLYLLPVSVFLVGVGNVLTYYNSRLKLYKDVAAASVLKSVVLASIQLCTGWFKSGPAGLFLGQLVSGAVANGKLVNNIRIRSNLSQVLCVKKMKAMGKKYADFPKYSAPAVLANSLSQNLINVLISSVFGVATLGYYSLVQRVLGMPMSIIGNSFGQVYFQAATVERKKTGFAVASFNKTLLQLVLVSIALFVPLYFVIEDLFGFFFGSQWRVAGEYAQYLIPFFAIRFVFSPLSISCSAFERQRLALALQVGLLVVSVLIFIYATYVGYGFNAFLTAFSIGLSIYYLFFLAIVGMIVRKII